MLESMINLLESIVNEPFITVVLILQVVAFFYTKKWISKLNAFFSNSENLIIKKRAVDNSFIEADVILCNNANKEFQTVLDSTNNYLLKNKGTVANLDILKDICQRRGEQIISRIDSTITLPLYLGLIGTFIGIIFGLDGIDYSSIKQSNGEIIKIISDASIESLLDSVSTAMMASALGLLGTVVNSAILYKGANTNYNNQLNNYYDFLQKELLPKLTEDLGDSLGTLKSTLDHFNQDFGENLNHYKDNFGLLNENLEKEKEFLDILNKIGLTNLSKEIVTTFDKISESKADFESFKGYQKSLNETVANSELILDKYNNVTTEFKEFNKNLEGVSEHILESSEFYSMFKKYLEQHFGNFKDRNDQFQLSIENLDAALTTKLKEFNEASKILLESANKDVENKKNSLESFLDGLDRKSTESLNNIAEATIDEFKRRLEVFHGQKENFKQSLDSLNSSFLNNLKEISDGQSEGMASYVSSLEEQNKKYNEIIVNLENELNKKVSEFGMNSLEQREQFNVDWRTTMDELILDVKDLFSKLNLYVGEETEALVKYIEGERTVLAEVISNNENNFKDLESISKILSLLEVDRETNVKFQNNMIEGVDNIHKSLIGDNGVAGINKNLIEIQKLLIQLNSNLKVK